ncbi:MAG: oxidoreductase [Chitinophagaceae bacterium]|nr:oxidoreductase [Chitinophagaceae bacterium]
MAKTILITGASTGLGETIGNYLSKKGHTVYGTSRTIEGQARPFHTLNMDVGNKESIDKAVQQIIAAHGRIDVLINNAGLGIASPIETVSIEDLQNVFDTNVTGIVRTCQSVLPHMREKKSGLIINISSIAAETGLPYRGIYSATKAAVERITEAMRIELAPFNIHICSVQPGGTKTDINKNRLKVTLPEDNVYKENFERTYELINKSVSNGLEPEIFAVLIDQIINSSKVKACYRVGKPVEKISVLLKKFLPATMYENMVKNHYKIR